jgi:hypothetical protein
MHRICCGIVLVLWGAAPCVADEFEDLLKRVPEQANGLQANGPFRWRELETFGTLMPDGVTRDDPVEFVVPMPGRPR